MKKIIKWHENYTYKRLHSWKMSAYHGMWLSFLKGFVFASVLMYLFR